MSDDRAESYWQRNGYAPCARCHTIRPMSEMEWMPQYGHHCADTAWCSRQAGLSEGATGLTSDDCALPPVPDGGETPTR